MNADRKTMNPFSKEENILYEWIEIFRKRPKMYFGERSIKLMDVFFFGYKTALAEFKIEGNISFLPLDLFSRWLAAKYQNMMSFAWANFILHENDNDDEKSFDVFFEEWDLFCEEDIEDLKRIFLKEDGTLIRYPKKYWPDEPDWIR